MNFWHLKRTNGMFFYGCDYANIISSSGRILARHALYDAFTGTKFEQAVYPCGFFDFIAHILKAVFSGELLYTPTYHPIPFISKQVVVCHDSYPFVGLRGTLKKILLKLSLATSRCKFGYINHGDSLRFVSGMVTDASRRVYLPNLFPAPAPIGRPASAKKVIGLLGTDSTKKNYAYLFSSVCAKGLSNEFKFLIYGYPTPYFEAIRVQFPEIDIQIVRSDECDIPGFLSQIHAVASVATMEGFGRPIAFALACGVPCYLIDCDVFREFFQGAAQFFSDVSSLVTKLYQDDIEAFGNGQHASFSIAAANADSAFKAGIKVIQGMA